MSADAQPPRRRSCTSRKLVYTLAALFSLDAFGGGFVVQSMLALWLYQTFGLSTATAGASVLLDRRCSRRFSYLVAVRIADRFGLVNTMVFTHLPSSLCLVAIPFVPSLAWSIVLLLHPQRAVADGRADAQLVRDGDRPARRARRRGERHVGAAEPRVGGRVPSSRATCSACRRSDGRS